MQIKRHKPIQKIIGIVIKNICAAGRELKRINVVKKSVF
jgi:hypothetical protein